MKLKDLERLARNSGQLMAEDKTTGVRVTVKHTPLGLKLIYSIGGERHSYRKALEVQDGAQ